MRKETAYSTLKSISEIVDVNERKAALRRACADNNLLAITVQRCYHPSYNFNLPEGPLPPDIARKSGHDAYGVFYRNMRRWEMFRIPSEVPFNSNYKKEVLEAQFIDLYEAVADDDADLLVAVKDKKLPWETLNKEFVMDALPELFPGVSTEVDHAADNQESAISVKDHCTNILNNDPKITRKNFIKTIKALFPDIADNTITSYFYQIKKGKK